MASTVIVAVLAVACGSGDDDSPSEGSVPGDSGTTTTAGTTTPVPVAEAEAVLRERAELIVALLDDPDAVPTEQLAAAFADEFLTQIPVEAVVDTARQATAGTTGPWSVAELAPDGWAAVATMEAADGTRLAFTFQLEEAAPHRFVGAQIAPDLGAIQDDPGTLEEIGSDLAAVAPIVEAAVFDVSDGGCTPEWSLGAGAEVPIGSVFKLWVLAAVARAVEQGEISWDQDVVVEEQYRSSPDGDVYLLADGDTVTVRELAVAMISVSDNTATDHLIGLVGRSAVEAVLADIGVSSAARNLPLLSTAELFKLKFVDLTLGELYLALPDEAGRRQFLADNVTPLTLPWIADPSWSSPSLVAPTLVLDLEWFATADDLCRTFGYLAELDARPGLDVVGDALSVNAGFPGLETDWAEVWYKGGSEPGVLVTAHRLVADDGRALVVVAALVDPEEPIAEVPAFTAITRLLAAV